MSKRNKWLLIILGGSTVIILIIGSILNNPTSPFRTLKENKANDTEMFRESYKERISNDPDQEEFTEYYDEATNIYSNYLYGFSVIFPPNWTTDRGFSEHTVIRGVEEDSAITYSVNVFDIEGSENDDFSIWQYFDTNKTAIENQFISDTESSLQSTLHYYSVQKVTFDNHHALKREFIYDVKHIDIVYQMKAILYQISKPPYLFSIGLHVPYLFYEENPDRYSSIVTNFYFNPQKQ